MKILLNTNWLIAIIAVTILCLTISSCDNDDQDSPHIEYNNGPENFEKYKDWYNTLLNTSWRLQSSISYYSSGKVIDNTVPGPNSSARERELYKKYLTEVITLTSDFDGYDYILKSSTRKGIGLWYITDEQELVLLDSYYWDNNVDKITPDEAGFKLRLYPVSCKIESCSSEKISLYTDYGNGIISKYVFSRVYDWNNSDTNPQNPEDNEADFYETNFTSTEYTNKITVNFYFSERVSSATIKYGTTPSCSSSKAASVSAKNASTTITGLKPGTKYYFKCTAKSNTGQSCTTNTYPVMTFYE